MIKRLIMLLLIAGLALAACTSESAPPAETQDASSPATAPANDAATAAIPANTTPEATPEPVIQGASSPANCVAASAHPTPDATQTALFPPPSDKDWIKGPPEAYITILEYSDFM